MTDSKTMVSSTGQAHLRDEGVKKYKGQTRLTGISSIQATVDPPRGDATPPKPVNLLVPNFASITSTTI